MPTFYVTTPIYYVNELPHIGNAYTTVAADALARYRRLRGDRVFFATGADENGLKIAQAARERGLEPRPFVDQMSEAFRACWQKLNISYDRFIQTTEPEHRLAVQSLVEQLYRTGDIYPGEYEGWYCQSDETFFRESELIDGRCPNPEGHHEVEWLGERGFFFRLSAYQDRLLEYIESHPDFVQPAFRRNEVLSFIRGGLKDVCVSRIANWGIPMPAALPDSQGMVIYVWFDALVNYLTCAGYPAEPGRFAEVWPANCHLMAKDILVRFHATMWPAMLMAAGLPLPEHVFAHGYWTFTGQKISKSRGQRIDPVELAQNLAVESGARFELAVDALRYFLLREVPFGQDGEFSVEALVGRFNADLANDLGNMLNRILPLISRYCGGKIPPKSDPDPEVRSAAATAVDAYERALETLDFSAALRAVWALLAELNRIVDQRAPWALAKNGKTAELNATLYALAEGLRITALLVSPIMPSTAEAIELQLGAPELAGRRRWSQAGEWGVLPGNRAIRPGKPLFPRYEERRPAPSVETAAAPTETRTEMISYQDFQKLDLRIGEITAAEKIPGADKLLKLTVDLGGEVRTLVAGIALSYAPDQLIGKRVAVLTNLQPATIRGVTSQGMALAAFREGDDASIALLVPDRPLDAGSHIK